MHVQEWDCMCPHSEVDTLTLSVITVPIFQQWYLVSMELNLTLKEQQFIRFKLNWGKHKQITDILVIVFVEMSWGTQEFP